MKQQRYDIEAGKNVLTMMKRTAPGEHARLMARLRGNVGLAGLGAAEESEPGFWDRLFSAGAGALTTIADYKMQEQQNKALQDQYDEAVEAEMRRQAMLAEQARTQAMEYQNQMELSRQTQELTRAAQRSKGTMNTALIGVGALVGLWIFYRLVV